MISAYDGYATLQANGVADPEKVFRIVVKKSDDIMSLFMKRSDPD